MTQLFGRKASLIVSSGSKGLDLSQLHFKFHVGASDHETPNNMSVRVYNLAKNTSHQVQTEFQRVTLQAGYEGQFGIIFDGQIKQFRRGRENATDHYLDILAADGDKAYNNGIVNQSLAAGSTLKQRYDAVVSGFQAQDQSIKAGYTPPSWDAGGTLPRGKVLFGMAREYMRDMAQSQYCSWSIQNGVVHVIENDGYLPGEAVVLTSKTGMIGIPEQTDQGIKVRTLLNPKLAVGNRVQIDNASINQTINKDPNSLTPYNSYKNLQLLANVASDGFYRILVIEHTGDTRGQDWYSDLICLSIDPSTQKVIARN